MLLKCGVGDQSWIIIGRTDVEAEASIIWPPHVKSWLIWKDPDAGKDWGQEEKGATKDEMVGWHHRLYGHGFGWTPGVGVGQGGLACCGSWGHNESDMTEDWTELNHNPSSCPLPLGEWGITDLLVIYYWWNSFLSFTKNAFFLPWN